MLAASTFASSGSIYAALQQLDVLLMHDKCMLQLLSLVLQRLDFARMIIISVGALSGSDRGSCVGQTNRAKGKAMTKADVMAACHTHRGAWAWQCHLTLLAAQKRSWQQLCSGQRIRLVA